MSNTCVSDFQSHNSKGEIPAICIENAHDLTVTGNSITWEPRADGFLNNSGQLSSGPGNKDVKVYDDLFHHNDIHLSAGVQTLQPAPAHKFDYAAFSTILATLLLVIFVGFLFVRRERRLSELDRAFNRSIERAEAAGVRLDAEANKVRMRNRAHKGKTPIVSHHDCYELPIPQERRRRTSI